jgi:hypothetical protein
MRATAQGPSDRRSNGTQPTCAALSVPTMVLMRTSRRLATTAALTLHCDTKDNLPAPIGLVCSFRYRPADARSGMIKSSGARRCLRLQIRTLSSRSNLQDTRSPGFGLVDPMLACGHSATLAASVMIHARDRTSISSPSRSRRLHRPRVCIKRPYFGCDRSNPTRQARRLAL